jgi:hypothetical protein
MLSNTSTVPSNLFDAHSHHITLREAFRILHFWVIAGKAAVDIVAAAVNAGLEVLKIGTVFNTTLSECISHAEERKCTRMRDRKVDVSHAAYGVNNIRQHGKLLLNTPGV